MTKLLLHTSTGWPYVKDILDILFLPSGYEYRFRYRRKWVCEKLIDEGLQKIVNKEGIIIHTDVSKREEGLYDINDYTPIRRVIIKEIRDLDQFIWVSMKLGDWVLHEETNSEKITNATPNKYREHVSSTFYRADQLDFNYIDDDSEISISNWYSIVSKIKNYQTHIDHKSIFLKMINFTKLDCDNAVDINSNSDCFFSLVSGSDYKMEILQHYPNDDLFQDLKIKFNTEMDKITAFPPQTSIHGKYDVLKFLFHTKGNPYRVFSYLNLDLNSDQHMITSIPLNFKIEGSFVSLLVIIIGLFMILVFSDVKNLSITSLVLKLLSSIIFAALTKWAYR